jgi:hypothetical protein
VSKILGRLVKGDICDSPTIIYDSCTKLLEVLKVCVVNTMFLKKILKFLSVPDNFCRFVWRI